MRNQKANSGRSSEDELWQNLRKQFEGWWDEYGRTFVVVAVIAAAVLVAYNAYRKRIQGDEAATWEALSRLPDAANLSRMNPQDARKERQQIVESCQQTLDSRWGTSATPWVLLRLANARRELGNLEAAVAALGRLTEDYPDSRAAGMAKAPMASTLEEMGQYGEAADLYRELAETQGKDSVHWLDVARNLELAGQPQEAMKYYKQVSGNLDESTDLAQAAAYRLKYLKEGTALTPPPPPPPEEESDEEGEKAEEQDEDDGGQEGTKQPADTQTEADESEAGGTGETEKTAPVDSM